MSAHPGRGGRLVRVRQIRGDGGATSNAYETCVCLRLIGSNTEFISTVGVNRRYLPIYIISDFGEWKKKATKKREEYEQKRRVQSETKRGIARELPRLARKTKLDHHKKGE